MSDEQRAHASTTAAVAAAVQNGTRYSCERIGGIVSIVSKFSYEYKGIAYRNMRESSSGRSRGSYGYSSDSCFYSTVSSIIQAQLQQRYTNSSSRVLPGYIRSIFDVAGAPYGRTAYVSQRAHPPCDSPNTSRRFALGAINICLVGGNLTCSVPVLQGCEGLWPYDLRPTMA